MRTAMTLLALTLAAGCSAPDMSPTQCSEFCAKQGKVVASYRVGSSVPIFKPKPPVTCECASK